ncbi:unnamed protein product [Paramecium pentaurelia]|uniref:Uncharacterized protein n=1 Tax=Paramecium pentaurelia TaxID=43138 RepID=A0A8S1WEP5_9CILI|nr:unnamed protein product [Paramecium pentaurelia]
MKKQDYRIILKYSQLTLNALTFPYYHVNKGCQFNYFELDQLIQTELQKDESKQVQCPVCHVKGQLKIDNEYFYDDIEKLQNQFVINMKDQKIFKTQKLSYFDSIFSKNQEIFEMQQKFNSKLVNNDDIQNELNLQYLENLNVQRNKEIFQIFRKCSQKIQPTLIGVINFKLILFYHGLTIKIELEICDNTNKNNLIKFSDLKSVQMNVSQVCLIDNIIYLVVQYDKLNQLYRGDFDQIIEDNKNEPIFYVTIMPNYTLLGESRLLQFKNCTLMIGNVGSIILNNQNNQNVVMDEKIRIPQLNENSQFAVINDMSMILVGNNIQEKGVGFVNELYFSESKITEIQQNIVKYPNSQFDFSFYHNNSFYLLSSDKLNYQNVQVTQIAKIRDKNTFTITMNIINHHSYLKVKIIPTTKQKVGNVICALVGLVFEQSQTIFPGVLVFNDKDNIIEIELI